MCGQSREALGTVIRCSVYNAGGIGVRVMCVVIPLRTVQLEELLGYEEYLEPDRAEHLSRGRVLPLSSGGSSSPNQGERGPPVTMILTSSGSSAPNQGVRGPTVIMFLGENAL